MNPTTAARKQEGKFAAMSQELAKVISHTSELLDAGKPQKALDYLHQARLDSPWVSSCIAVCQMRLDNPQSALAIYRSLVGGGIILRRDAPAVFKTNYATAMLQMQNVTGCLGALRELNDQDHPAVQRLKATIARWVAGLSFFQKIGWYLGSEIKTPVPLDFPPGDLQ